MNIKSATFVKGIVEADDKLEDGKPQIAFIGRSNVGKSSLINALTKVKDLARTSSFPGRTQQINLFLINKAFYLADLPGYGYAKASQQDRKRLEGLINWYLFEAGYKQHAVVLIIDANVGLTDNDLQMLDCLKAEKKNIIIVANKIDKIKKSDYQKKLRKIQTDAAAIHGTGTIKIIPYSTQKNMGAVDLMAEFLK